MRGHDPRLRDPAYPVRLMNFISVRYGKAIVLVKDYGLDVDFLFTIFAGLPGKCLR